MTESTIKKIPSAEYTRAEVALHKTSRDLWIIVDGKVYDVTKWLKHHPGGERILQHHGGQDATIQFESFHDNKKLVRGHLSKFYIGNVVEEERELSEINKDFLRMKKELFDKGYFKFDGMYYLQWFLYSIFFEIMGIGILWWFGTGWIPYITALVCVVISQTKLFMTGHEIGHVVLKNFDLYQKICWGFFQGWSASWWKFRHYQHHAKPNVAGVDPDVVETIIVFGNALAEKWGKNHWGKFPFQHQHKYFMFIFGMMLLPVYFVIDQFSYIVQQKKWEQIPWILMFYLRWHIMFTPLLGGIWESFIFYFFMRILQSCWFTLTSSANHMPMEVVMPEVKEDWPTMQTKTTLNIKPNWFWNWIYGTFSLQLEHHFFPTMPASNIMKIRPYVMEFCKKHGLDYHEKDGLTGIVDIFKALQQFGQTWYEAWESTKLK